MIRKHRTHVALTFGAVAALLAPSARAGDSKDDSKTETSVEAPASAHAKAGPAEVQTGASVALLLGYGFNDAFKVGFGARGGYTLPMKVYVGGTLIYHLGTSVDVGGGQSVGVHALMVGAEGGYELAAGPVIVRPNLGLGLAILTLSNPSGIGGYSASSSNVYLAPGVTGLYPITSNIAVGADARFIIVSDANAFDMYLTGQYHF